MADFSQLNLYGQVLTVKDATARQGIANLSETVTEQTETINELSATTEELSGEIDALVEHANIISYANETITFTKGVVGVNG